MLQLGPFHAVKWEAPILPELIWLGLLNEHHGMAKGAQLALSLAKAAVAAKDHTWFAPASAYLALAADQRNEVLGSLRQSNELGPIKIGLTPLLSLYPECPLNFLFEDGLPRVEDHQLEKFKIFLAKLFDRREKPATFIQANAVYIAFVTGLLKVNEGSLLAKFPAIEKFPDTEESQRIASGIRAMINGFFGGETYDKSSTWPRYFWNRGLELEPCNLDEIYSTVELRVQDE